MYIMLSPLRRNCWQPFGKLSLTASDKHVLPFLRCVVLWKHIQAAPVEWMLLKSFWRLSTWIKYYRKLHALSVEKGSQSHHCNNSGDFRSRNHELATENEKSGLNNYEILKAIIRSRLSSFFVVALFLDLFASASIFTIFPATVTISAVSKS